MTTDTRAKPAPASPPLGDALSVPFSTFDSERAGTVAYYADPGTGIAAAGRPLVLIHSINAAPSSFELRPLFERYRGTRPVYSLDLPGFGRSERGKRRYSPELFAAAIEDFLAQVVGKRADLIALSLSSEFAARAALAAPERVTSLVMISPTGFTGRSLPSPAVARAVHGFLTLPGLSQWLFDRVASKPSIRYYLGKSFVGKAPQETIDYAYATSHQPGARHAPLYFLSTQLFTPKAAERLYAPLTCRVLVLADRDPYIRFDTLPAFVAAHANWSHERLAPHMGLPHWERPEETAAALDAFWAAA